MKKLSKGLRKHIRREKARIRREIFDKNDQQERIKELIEKKIQKRKHVAKDKLKT